MATQSPQSLPSFAQTFGGPTINRLPDMNNALPPIHHRASPLDRSRSAHTSPQPSSIGDHKHNARKRLHSESLVTEVGDGSGSDGRRSPRTVKVKQEVDNDSLPPSKPQQKQCESTHTPPSTSASPNPSKKRRMTITGIDTDVRRPSIDNGISPVVMGFTIRGDDPNALEQVRSMINLKHQQQALIEQRRGSAAGIVPPPNATPDVNIVNHLAANEERTSKPATGRSNRKSPNQAAATAAAPGTAGTRRPAVSAPSAPTIQQQQQSQPMSSSRPPTPPPSAIAAPTMSHRPSSHNRPATDSPPTHTHGHPPSSTTSSHSSTAHALPPPPTSFARRRASQQRGKKPADIVISPRTPQDGGLQPVIQSAPPIPRGGQTHSLPGRFPTSMVIPSLPPMMGLGQPPKRISTGQVPPTPTRLAMARHSVVGTTTHTSGTGRSPPEPSIPISASLVPPTPASLHHPGYSGEKAAFLAQFESFYDALNDSKQLKTWLGEQLQKSQALVVTLQKQQEQMEETVNSIVDKKMSAMRSEVYDLRVRVDELETSLRSAKAQGYSPNLSSSKGKGKANGHGHGHGHGHGASPVVPPTVPETYHFPPIDPLRRNERDPVRRVGSPASEGPGYPHSQTSSPVPFEVGKRLSVSAMRLDPRPIPPNENPVPTARASISHPPSGHYSQSSQQQQQPGSAKGNNWSPRSTKMSLPTSSARSSLSHTTTGPSQHGLSASMLPERPGLMRRTSGQGPSQQRQERTNMNPPEKRRASRSPEADEEARLERVPPKHLLEQRRASLGSLQLQHNRARSPMVEERR